MPPPAAPTLGEALSWAYANLAASEKAVHDGAVKFGPVHYAVRSRINREMAAGRMSPGSLMKDAGTRMKLPAICVYCGGGEAAVGRMSVDHVVPTRRGGADSSDNALPACRSCNSSKRDRDLFAWWRTLPAGEGRPFPPLFAVRVYLKQAVAYAEEEALTGVDWAEAPTDSPFDWSVLPSVFSPPAELCFTPWHERRDQAAADGG